MDDVGTLRLVRDLMVDPDVVWRAWTEDLAQWLWPERFATQVVLEPRAGAAYRVWSEEVGMGVSGVAVAAVRRRGWC
ncbi:SRPBCC family protein [Nocardioides marmoraquaticus]